MPDDLRPAMEIQIRNVNPLEVGLALQGLGEDGWSVGAIVPQSTGMLGVVVQRRKLLIEPATEMPKEPHA